MLASDRAIIFMDNSTHHEDPKGLDGKWSTLIALEKLNPGELSPADLRRMEMEYNQRDEKAKAPVVLGLATNQASEPVGHIDAVRRVGSRLEGKFTGVDPRVEHLHGRGAFPKKSVSVNRTVEGVTLGRVGLVHPKFVRGVFTDEETPSLDDLMREYTGEKELRFGEKAMKSPDYSGYVSYEFTIPEIRAQVAQNAVAKLKERGRWSDRHDRCGIPVLFAELVGTPGFCMLSEVLDRMVNLDPTYALASECARYYAREKGISFGEALDLVGSGQLPDSGKAYSQEEIRRGIALDRETKRIARERNLSYANAMQQAQEDRPELVPHLSGYEKIFGGSATVA